MLSAFTSLQGGRAVAISKTFVVETLRGKSPVYSKSVTISMTYGGAVGPGMVVHPVGALGGWGLTAAQFRGPPTYIPPLRTPILSDHHSLFFCSQANGSLICSSFTGFFSQPEGSFCPFTGQCFTHSLHSREYIHSIHACGECGVQWHSTV